MPLETVLQAATGTCRIARSASIAHTGRTDGQPPLDEAGNVLVVENVRCRSPCFVLREQRSSKKVCRCWGAVFDLDAGFGFCYFATARSDLPSAAACKQRHAAYALCNCVSCLSVQ